MNSGVFLDDHLLDLSFPEVLSDSKLPKALFFLTNPMIASRQFLLILIGVPFVTKQRNVIGWSLSVRALTRRSDRITEKPGVLADQIALCDELRGENERHQLHPSIPK